MKALYHDYNRILPSLSSVITIVTLKTSPIVAYFISGTEPRHIMM